MHFVDNGEPESRLFNLPASYVRWLGANAAAVLYGFAKIIKKREGELRKGKFKEYRAGSHPAFSIAGHKLAKSFPWLNKDTYWRSVYKLRDAGLVIDFDNPHGKSRRKEGKWVRNPLMYSMRDEVVKKTLDHRQLLYFTAADAIEFKSVNTALVWNRVAYLFEVQARENTEQKSLILTPRALSGVLKLKESTIRDALAKIVATGRLAREKGTSEYRLLAKNPLSGKTFVESTPTRKHVAPEGMDPEQVKLAVDQMKEDVKHWWTIKTHQTPLLADEIHFKKAAELCFYEHYNPSLFVGCNLGAGKRNRKPCFLHGINSETKYQRLNPWPLAKHVQWQSDSLRADLMNTESKIRFNLKNNKYASIEEMMLDENSSIPAWYRVVTCPPESPLLNETIEKYSDTGRREIQSQVGGMEALFTLDGIHAKHLFPYYNQYFDYQEESNKLQDAVKQETTTSIDATIAPDVLDAAYLVSQGYKPEQCCFHFQRVELTKSLDKIAK